VDDQAEMLDAARRIDDDEVVFVRSANFLELRYELPQVSAMAQGATADEVVFMRSANFLERRYEPPQVSAMAQGATADEVPFMRSANFLEQRYEPPQGRAMHLCRNRIMIRQLQFLLVLPIPLMSVPEVPGKG
jgi:hypothetical protein